MTEKLRMRDVQISLIPFSWSVHHNDYPISRRLRSCIARLRDRQPGLSAVVEQLIDWDIDLVFTNTLATDIGHYSSKKLGLPHVWHVLEFGDRDHGLYPDPGWYIYARQIAASDQVIALSEAIAAHLRRKATLLPTQAKMPNLNVAYAGIVGDSQAERRYEQCCTDSIPCESPLFMIIGQIKPSKGQGVAVRALMKLRESHPHARLAIVGDGQRKWIEQVIEEESAEEFVDLWGSTDGPWEAYAQADVALMCSELEAMGRVTAEAMIAGTPVIGHDQGGTSELIEHGTTGRLYQNGTNGLAREMEWILSHPTEVNQMIDDAWDYASQRFTNERYAGNIVQVWEEALEDCR